MLCCTTYQLLCLLNTTKLWKHLGNARGVAEQDQCKKLLCKTQTAINMLVCSLRSISMLTTTPYILCVDTATETLLSVFRIGHINRVCVNISQCSKTHCRMCSADLQIDDVVPAAVPHLIVLLEPPFVTWLRSLLSCCLLLCNLPFSCRDAATSVLLGRLVATGQLMTWCTSTEALLTHGMRIDSWRVLVQA